MDESTEAVEQVYMKYRGLIRNLINSIVINNSSVVSVEDLQQAGALALIIALKSYDPSVGSLQSYIRRCIRNALLEQANSFNSTSTVDEKVRRQANAIVKMRKEGLSDDAIMVRLGIKTRATFLSLVSLVENNSIDLDQVEVTSEESLDEERLFSMLDEINLSPTEMQFIRLTIDNYSMKEIQDEMSLSRTALFDLKASIRDAILAWGRS